MDGSAINDLIVVAGHVCLDIIPTLHGPAWPELARARLFHFGYPPIMRAAYRDGGCSWPRLPADIDWGRGVTALSQNNGTVELQTGMAYENH